MDEFEHRLCTKNVAVISRTISQLIDIIKEKSNSEKSAKQGETKEIKYLKEKCTGSNSLVAVTAARGLIRLAEDGILNPSDTISELVSLLMNADGYSGLIFALIELLVLENETQPNKYNLTVPQHPLISVLLHSPPTWIDIFEHIKSTHIVCAEKSQKLNKLFSPFYLYVFCDCNNRIPHIFKQRLWTFLVENFLLDDPELFSNIIGWLRYDEKEKLYMLCGFLVEILEFYLGIEEKGILFEVYLLCLSSVLVEMLRRSVNPRYCLKFLGDVVDELDSLECSNCLLFLVSDCIAICPVAYLDDLLQYCEKLLNKYATNILIIKSIKVCCLHWVLQSSALTTKCLEPLNRIIRNEYKQQDILKTTKFVSRIDNNTATLLNTNENTHLAIELTLLAERISTDEDLINWLKNLVKKPEILLKRMQNFLFGIVIFNFRNKDVTIHALKVQTVAVECYPEISTNFLTVILYKLANNTDNRVHFQLLKCIPKMGVVKENLGIIVSTLQVFATSRNHPKLKVFALRLFYDLWCLQVRCYPMLQNLLVSQASGLDDYEFNTAKAHVLMKLCEKKPELYGTELAAHLSKVLNRCKGPGGGIASSFALLGLKHLCKQGIVDIVTAWNALAPSFNQENRTEVLVSLCDLLSEVANLPENQIYDTFTYEITGKLWKYATYHPQIEVNTAAYKSLSSFTFEQISANVPDILEDPDLTPDTFGHIPASAWIKLLQNINYASLKSAGDMLITLVGREIAGYVKGTYHVGEGQKEPQNYNKLYNHSIVRALGNYVKENCTKFESGVKEVYLQCLRVLSKEYLKPLPPLDWCFLQELVHGDARKSCIRIASKQVVLSGTARRFMENFIVSVTNVTNNEEDIKLIYENLKHLTNSIQPMLMKPFFENTFFYGSQNSNTDLISFMLRTTSDLLRNKDVLDVNKAVLTKVIETEFKNTRIEEKVFVECFVNFPEKYLVDLINLKDTENLSKHDLEVAIEIRTKILLHQKEPMYNLLDEAFFTINSVPSVQNFLLERAITIFATHRENQSSLDWFLEFLGQIQVNLADNRCANMQEVLFLFDIFMTAIIVFSGHDSFGDPLIQNNRFKLLPEALSALIKTHEWDRCVSQILEWLYFMANYVSLPLIYRKVFQNSLVALRHEEVFSESHKWMRYVGGKVVIEN